MIVDISPGQVVPRRSRIWHLFIAIAAAVVCLSACASPAVSSGSGGDEATGSSTQSAGGYRYDYLGPGAQSENWDSGTVVVEPPDQGQAATADLSTVVELCTTGALVCGSPDSTAQVSLVVATSNVAGNGTQGPLSEMNKELVYQLVWQGDPCAPAGPATPSGITSCTVVSFADALTGAAIYSMSGPALG